MLLVASSATDRVVGQVRRAAGFATGVAGCAVNGVDAERVGRNTGLAMFDLLVADGARGFLGGEVAGDAVLVQFAAEACAV